MWQKTKPAWCCICRRDGARNSTISVRESTAGRTKATFRWLLNPQKDRTEVIPPPARRFSLLRLPSSLPLTLSPVPPPSGTRKLEYAGSTWHEGCFICHSCEQPIGSKSFIPDKDEHYCVACYEDKFAPRCTRCKKVGRAVTAQRFPLFFLSFKKKMLALCLRILAKTPQSYVSLKLQPSQKTLQKLSVAQLNSPPPR